MDKKVKDKALHTLDNMESIVRTERLISGDYVTDEWDDDEPKSKKVACTGPRYCLIGTEWVAHGEKPKVRNLRGEEYLWFEGITDAAREGYMHDKPALKLVYDTMNEVADERFAKNKNLHRGATFNSSAEAYFENNNPGRHHIITMIGKARKKIEAM